MALTFGRWLALAIAASLVAAAYFLAPLADRPRVTDARLLLSQREQEAGRFAARAADQLRLLQIRDSIAVVIGRLPRTDSSRMLLNASIPVAMRAALIETSRRARAGRTSVRQPVDIAFVFDAGTVVRGVSRGYNTLIRADYLLPKTSGDRCTAIVRMQHLGGGGIDATPGQWVSTLNSDILSRRLLGPCAFYETFGMPGPGVDGWLMNRAWTYGVVADWSRDFPRWEAPSWRRTSQVEVTGWHALREYVSTIGYRCITGARDVCRDVLVNGQPDMRYQRHPEAWGDRIIAAGNLAAFWWRSAELGPNQGALLSGMVRSLGAERFQKFWSSPLPVNEAFRGATGQDIGDWTYEWSVAAYGPDRGRGPAVPSKGGALALLAVVVAIMAGVWMSRRRQIAV